MALTKSIVTASGATATYHRIMRVDLQLRRSPTASLVVVVNVGFYLSAETRTANKAPDESRNYTFNQTPQAEGDTLNDLLMATYELLKTHADFTDATDC